MLPIILALSLAAAPPVKQPDFQCGMEDAACWRRMVLWEYNERIADEQNLDGAAKALQHSQKETADCQNATRSSGGYFGWGFAAGLFVAGVVGGILVSSHHGGS